jgi:ABC-type multidrug transport system ATPase subunit
MHDNDNNMNDDDDNDNNDDIDNNKNIMDGFCLVETVRTKARKNPRELLCPMALDFPANAVTAILGPSGSGKTTLLSVITDSIQSNVTCRAEVYLPGVSVIVPQDDRLHGFYTVRSYLEHYARLSGLYAADTADNVNDRIERLIQQLGLVEQTGTIVGDLFLKGLSGGQKRRLSIALEALSEPGNFFLDEPTSGLDSESALQVMEFLKSYVRQAAGRRVILTIHQPSSFIWQTIDHVILLSKGQLVYNGGREQCEIFFADSGFPTLPGWNPADHYVTAINDEFRLHALPVTEWASKFKAWKDREVASSTSSGSNSKNGRPERTNSILGARLTDEIATTRSRSVVTIVELTRRYFLNLALNPGILGTRIAMYSMLALMVGALFWDLGERNDFEVRSVCVLYCCVYWWGGTHVAIAHSFCSRIIHSFVHSFIQSIQSRAAISFYCVAFFIFMSVAVLPFTVMERGIVDKEVGNKYYHPIMYQISQGISSIPGAAILAFLVTLLIITMTKLNDPLWYFLNMFLALTVAEALAQLISHVVPHFIIGMALLAGMFGFFMLFQGFMLVPSEFPNWLGWVYYIAFHTYSWRTFMVTEFRDEKVFTGNDDFKSGEDVLVFYEIEGVNRAHDMITLAGYALFIHCVSFLVLHLRYTMFRGKIEPLSSDVSSDLSNRSLVHSKKQLK